MHIINKGVFIIKHIVLFSGGKDSTALTLMMIEKGMPIDYIVFCDTGKEFPAMYRHIEKVEKYIEFPVTILRSSYSFDYYLGEYVKIKGKNKNKIGYGWPDMHIRWCTSALKREPLLKFLNSINDNVIEYHGIAFDEKHRTEKNKNRNIKYPLVEWGITEKQALDYCYNKGFDWEGLYKIFNRVSCYCCPLKGEKELRKIYFNFPKLWKEMMDIDKKSYRSFHANHNLSYYNNKFYYESLQLSLKPYFKF